MKGSALQVFLILGAILLGIFLVPQILTSRTGGISALIKFLGIGVSIICLVRPKSAPWVLTLIVFTEDYLKKIAVYYGVTAQQVLYEVLGVSIGAFLAAALGSTLTIAYSRRFPLLPVVLYLFGAALCFIIAGILQGAQGTLAAGYTAASIGLPVIMSALTLLYFKGRLDLFERLLDFQFSLSVIWAVVAIKQILIGFSPMEWYYAETGLSPVASMQMLGGQSMGMSPRPFGLGSGAPNINGIACFSLYGIWMGLTGSRVGKLGKSSPALRMLFAIGGILIFSALFFGRLKTTAVLIPISFVLYFVYKHKWSTATFYAVAGGMFLWLVIQAEWLLEKLPEWNEPISRLTGGRATILTFSDRLYSLGALKDPSLYSLFGLERTPRQHDFISMILYNVGVAGLSVVVIFGVSVLICLHRLTWRLDVSYRRFYVLLITMLIPYTLVLALVGSGSLHVTPNNIRIWTLTGGVLLMATRIPEVMPKRMLSSEAEQTYGRVSLEQEISIPSDDQVYTSNL